METIHSRSYTYIIKNLYPDPSDVFDTIIEDQKIEKRSKSVTDQYDHLIKLGYKEDSIKGKILCPTKEDLDLLDYQAVKNWFKKNKPSIVIIAAAKVGGIIANSQNPFEFIFENLKIQTNLIEISWKNTKIVSLGPNPGI